MKKANPESEVPEEPETPRDEIVTRASGHLPDFEEEEMERKHKEEVKERESMTLSMKEKDAEISRLQEALGKMEEAFLEAVAAKSDDGSSADKPKKDMLFV